MILSGYEEVEHTADIALKVWGKDFYSLLRQSAKGMYFLMGVIRNQSVFHHNTFKIDDGSPEMQLVDFLNEILFLAEDGSAIYDKFTFQKDCGELKVQAAGFGLKTIQRSIKAVTFHDLKIIESKTGLEAKITFDV